MAEGTAVATRPQPSVGEVVEQALVKGDFSKLTTEQRLGYVKQLCESLGLNFLTRPFDFFTDKKSGKMTLYARKDCTDQLRKIHGVTLEVAGRDVVFVDCLLVQVRATITHNKAKRHDEDIGVVCLAGLKGDDKANALMKAVTKAKRRVTLSICGLGGIPDESELEDVAAAEMPRVEVHATPAQSRQQPAAPATLSERPATPEQLGQIKTLKGELELTGETWTNFLQPFGKTPSQASEQEAGEMLRMLHHLRAVQAPEPAHVRNGTGGEPAGAGFRPDGSVPF